MNMIINTLNVLLEKSFTLTGDWGLTIILLTLLVRLLLLPISIKQKSALIKQQEFSKKIEEIKEKYKDNKEKMESEIAKISREGARNLLGCSVTLLQIPIMYSLYNVFTKMPSDITSAIIPWMVSLKLPDPYFIIPVISVAIQLFPNLLATAGILKGVFVSKLSFAQVLSVMIFTSLIMVKAPLTLGLYWATSNLFTTLEQIGYSLYMKNKFSGAA